MKVNERIKQIRILKGLTLEDVASKMGCTLGAVSHWETGRNEIRISQCEEFSKKFDVPVEAILIDKEFKKFLKYSGKKND